MDKGAIADLLKDHNAEWTLRKDSLGLIRQFVLSSASSQEAIISYLTELQPLICIQLEDRRSMYCKEVCELITTFASRLGESFELLSAGYITALFPLLVVTIKVIAESAQKCILSLLPFSTSSIPFIAAGIKDKHPVLRARCNEYMSRIVEQAPTDKLNNPSYLEAIDDSIRNAIADSNAEARTIAKRSYQSFNKRFPDHAQKLFSSLDSSLQNRLVESKPAPKKGGFADFLAKKQAAKVPSNSSVDGVQEVILSKTDDNNDNEGNNNSSSSSPSGSSSPSLSSTSSSSTSNNASTSSTNTPPAAQSHSLAASDDVSTPIETATQPAEVVSVSESTEVVSVSETPAELAPISKIIEVAPAPTAEATASVESIEVASPKLAVPADITTPVVESISSSMEITPPSPTISRPLSSPSESTEQIPPSSPISLPSVEVEPEIKPTTEIHTEPEPTMLSDSQSSDSSTVDESRTALTESLSETIERLPSPLSDRKSITDEGKRTSPIPATKPKTTTKAPTTKSATTSKPTTTTTLKTTTSKPTLSSTARPALRSMTNVLKPSTSTTTTKEPLKSKTNITNIQDNKTTTTTSKATTVVSKKTSRAAYTAEDKENQTNVRASSTEPKPAKKLRVAAPSTEINSIAARVKTIRRAAAVVATSTLVKSSSLSSSSLSSSKSSSVKPTTSTLKSKTTTKRPWL